MVDDEAARREALGQDKTCFVIGPIGDRLSPIGSPARQRYEDGVQMWENVFEPAIHAFGMKAVRADKITQSGEIAEQIFTFLRDSDVVLADVTLGNSNVMYELGMRHTKPGALTLQVGENDRLPFDIQAIRTIMFIRTEAGLISLRTELTTYLETGLTNGSDELTATRVWSQSNLNSSEVQQAVDKSEQLSPVELAELEQEEKGLVEMMAEGEAALEALTPIMSEFTAHIQDLGSKTSELGEEMETCTSFAQRLTVIKIYDESIAPTVSGLERTSTDFVKNVESLDFMMNHIANAAKADDSTKSSSEFQEMAQSVVELSEASAEGASGMASMLQPVKDMRKTSNILTASSKSIEHSANRILLGANTVSGWGAMFENLREA